MFGAYDWIILLIFLGTVLCCTLRGFVKSLTGIIRFALALLITKLLSPPLASVLSEKLIGPRVYPKLEAEVSEMIDSAEEAVGLDSLFSGENSDFSELINQYGGSEQLEVLESQYGEGVAATEESISEMVRSFASPWVDTFSMALAAIIVFVASFVVIFLVTLIFSALIRSIKVLKRTDHILGAVLGVVTGICGIVAFCYVCSFCISFCTILEISPEPMTTAIDTSAMFGHVYRFVTGFASN